MSHHRTGRRGLTMALDNDVLAIVQKFLDDDASPLPHRSEVFTHIMKSNSALKRRPRAALEASIERVLEVLKEDRDRDRDRDQGRESDDSDASGVMDAIEGEFADMTGPSKDARGLNKGLTRLWNTNGGNFSSGPESTIRPTTPKKSILEVEAPKKLGRKTQEPPAKRRKLEMDRSPPDFTDFGKLGGVTAVRDQLEGLLTLPLLRSDIYADQGFEPPRGILLHGPPGCGKTAVANAIAAEMRVPFIPISAPSVVSGMSGESEKALRDHFEEAKKLAPCIIFIDEIDAITPKRESAQRQMETRIVAQLLTCMDDIALEKTGGKVVVVLAATNRPDSLDPALRRGGRFDIEINMPIPDEPTRRDILDTLTKALPLDGSIEIRHLAKRTAGFVGADLKDLVNRSAQMALDRFRKSLQQSDVDMQVESGSGAISDANGSEGAQDASMDLQRFRSRLELARTSKSRASDVRVTQADFDAALPFVQPSLKREGFATVPDTSWRNIGALGAIREQLMLSIVTPILEPEMYRRVGITAPAGVLLWGPPGCGKTLLAKAVANESMANFISVKGPELMNKYVGESEREVRLLFTRARSSTPCIIFFDELDALVPRRGADMTESGIRVVNTLLTEMDGLDKREGIYIIGATNRPDMIDPAMLRPGRLETPLYVDLPGPDERAEILQTQCLISGNAFDEEIAAIARSCERFSGADLEALRRTAAMECLRRRSCDVELQDWQRAARLVKPSVDPRAERQFKRLLKTFGNAVIDSSGDDEVEQEA